MGKGRLEAFSDGVIAIIITIILQTAIVAHHGPQSKLARALGRDWKGKISPVLYVAAILLAFVNQWISYAIYVGVALMWLVPDRRIESRLQAERA